MSGNKIRGIYRIQNLVTKKSYIGSSKNVRNRLRNHEYSLNQNEHINTQLQHDWNWYGKNAFEMSVIETVENSVDLAARERYWIHKELESVFGCYNMIRNVGERPLDAPVTDKPFIIPDGANSIESLTVEQVAMREVVSTGRVRQWLRSGQLIGAKKFGNSWVIPNDYKIDKKSINGRPKGSIKIELPQSLSSENTCSICAGSGRDNKDPRRPCDHCDGEGKVML